MSYSPSFNPSYPAWHDSPTEDTPVRAAVFSNYDAALTNIESFLSGSTAVKPDEKNGLMTNPVGVDSQGKLWSTSGTSQDNTAYSMLHPTIWTADTEYDFGDGFFGQRITDTITAIADATDTQYLLTDVDSVALCGGYWVTSNDDKLPVNVNTGAEVAYISTTSDGTVTLNTTDAGARTGKTFDVWVIYTKVS